MAELDGQHDQMSVGTETSTRSLPHVHFHTFVSTRDERCRQQ